MNRQIFFSFHLFLWSLFLFSMHFGTCSSVSGKNILFFNGFSSHSHLVAMEPLAHRLADRGHHLTFVSPMKSENKHPNITYFCPESVLASQDDMNEMGAIMIVDRLKNKRNNLCTQADILWDGIRTVCETFWVNPEFQKWIEDSIDSFDLVVIDSFSRECAFPLAHIFRAKTIVFSTSPIIYGDHDTFGFGVESSWSFSFETDYWLPEVIDYEWNNIKWYLWRQYKYLPSYDLVIQRAFRKMSEKVKKAAGGEILPPIAELEKKTGLYFINTHFSSDFGRAFPPFIVPIGGMHCKDSKGIKNKEILDFVEDPNSDNFIYISFGSFFQISALPPQLIQVFLDTLASFPRTKFLWKWEGEFPKGAAVPKNIYFSKWFPQQDVLGHKKCRGYIMQGGLMSLQQTVYHGVPVIVIPASGDQEYNAKIAAKLGFGIHLQFAELTLDIFKASIQELLHNPKYRNKVQELSILAKDRPQSPVETAVYWTEYVLRHGNVDHLKSPGIHQFWWQRRLLHIYGPFFFGLFLTILAVFKVLKCLIFSTKNGGDSKVKSTGRKKTN